MKQEEKTLELHFVNPLIHTRCGEPFMAKKVEYKYRDKVELIISDGLIYCPYAHTAYTDLLAPVIETEDEIRKMVEGELIIVEFNKKRKCT